MRDEVLAAVRKGRSICENIDYDYLSEDDRQANTEAVDFFKWIETDLETVETHDEMLKAIGLAKQLVDSQWFKHLRAGNEQ
jgi:Tfp pilus assembly PilM family ATPase